jgi:gamma-butyrobetaine dioxygenase
MALIKANSRLASSFEAPIRRIATTRGTVRFQSRMYSKQMRPPIRTTALPVGSREAAYHSLVRASTTHTTQLGRYQHYSVQTTSEKWRSAEGPDGPDLNLEYVRVAENSWHPVFLRDACTCPRCVDPSSTQKTFQTTDIPADITAKSVETQKNGDVQITWMKDIPGFESDHISVYPESFFQDLKSVNAIRKATYDKPRTFFWDKNRIEALLQYVNYHDYMTDDKSLHRALLFLKNYGILLLRNVPDSEDSVEKIAGRMGPIRDTFYGRTWDVKSVPNAKNVAYTQQYLGLHMDLLYMQNPPGFQLLHCLKNTCKGGSSIFSDSFRTADCLNETDFEMLAKENFAFHYKNDGEHYHYQRPVFEVGSRVIMTSGRRPKLLPELLHVNYSPPFQTTLPYPRQRQGWPLPGVLKSLRKFARISESPRNVFEYKLQEGECVVFNNRRVLHGRKEFEATEGERWLKGAYIDTDVFNSRYRMMQEKYGDTLLMRDDPDARFVHPDLHEKWLVEAEQRKAKYEASMEAKDEGVTMQEVK